MGASTHTPWTHVDVEQTSAGTQSELTLHSGAGCTYTGPGDLGLGDGDLGGDLFFFFPVADTTPSSTKVHNILRFMFYTAPIKGDEKVS
jgi:hypothetical protein